MHADDAHKLAEQHFTTLVAALEAGRSDALVRYLETASRFHTYSFRNQCLIAAQCPTATRVAGYQAWRQLGRWVRRGETGIVILAPITRRRADVDADGDASDDAERTRVHGFRSAYVFDIAQTDGDPLPTIAHDTTGDPGVYLAALEQAITDAGVVITRRADLGGAHGYSQPGRITILESLTPADTTAVLVHEFAHELLHQRGDDRPASKTVRETEAEAVAFIVGTAIGIRSSVDATDYIQLYDGNANTLRQSLHRIQATAKTILSALPLEAPAIAAHETTRLAS
jgi:antirestriction protein ArdC